MTILRLCLKYDYIIVYILYFKYLIKNLICGIFQRLNFITSCHVIKLNFTAIACSSAQITLCTMNVAPLIMWQGMWLVELGNFLIGCCEFVFRYYHQSIAFLEHFRYGHCNKYFYYVLYFFYCTSAFYFTSAVYLTSRKAFKLTWVLCISIFVRHTHSDLKLWRNPGRFESV